MTNPTLVELTRGGLVESRHRGAIAVVDAQGRSVASWGNTELPVFPRSAFKSLQAVPLVETGAADRFSVCAEELTLACASHSGEPMHTERVSSWLQRIDCQEADLACGPHSPFHEPTSHEMIRKHQQPCRIHNNCSGKHTGFLTLARHLNAPVKGYEHPDHVVQTKVRSAIAEICGVEPSSMTVGIDGCAAPNYAIPLRNLALGMARLGSPATLHPDRARAAGTILSAWRSFPKLVSGTGRACADLIEASFDRTVVKTGAEAVFMAAAPSKGIGIAVKIDDGTTRAAETAMAQLLVLLGLANPDDPRITKHAHPPIKNWRGDTVGERRVTSELKTLRR